MLYYAAGSADTELSDEQLRDGLFGVLEKLGPRQQVIALPPDFTRFHSRAGQLTCLAHQFYGNRLTDVMPALGTHFEMPDWQTDKMFPGLPKELLRYHDWRNDVVTIGTVPGEYVAEVTENIYREPWPCQMNKLVWEGKHDLVLSIGQVVPHEVIGMANYNKNLFVGTGGVRGINESHFIGAVYGMERMMGRANTPLRRILNYAQDHFCKHLPLLYVQTVIGSNANGDLVVHGLFIGDDVECFERACELSLEVNFEMVPHPLKKVVVYLAPEEFHSTWLGNKAIYRTRLAIADAGELIVLAPAVSTFGEDPQIDKLIRKYGYITTPEVLAAVEKNSDLRANLSAAAHLIHGSPEERFTVTYCPGKLTQKEIEGVGYQYGDLAEYSAKYDINKLTDGEQAVDGENIFFIRNPALGLWAHRSRMTD
ncbi:MAG: D-mannonate epimerase [Planctomycetaceae bacterium]|nr:D-mannonate epimerase [Planctomycetaceae bacterium]